MEAIKRGLNPAGFVCNLIRGGAISYDDGGFTTKHTFGWYAR